MPFNPPADNDLDLDDPDYVTLDDRQRAADAGWPFPDPSRYSPSDVMVALVQRATGSADVARLILQYIPTIEEEKWLMEAKKAVRSYVFLVRRRLFGDPDTYKEYMNLLIQNDPDAVKFVQSKSCVFRGYTRAFTISRWEKIWVYNFVKRLEKLAEQTDARLAYSAIFGEE
jgi:hypothetical protein